LDKVAPQNEKNDSKPTSTKHTTAGLGLSERELAKKDIVQKDLTLVLDWMVANKVLFILAIGILGLSGVGYVMYNQVRRDTNLKIQDQYYAIEKDYMKTKADFEEADKQAKDAEAKANDKTKKDPKAKAEVPPAPKVRASGDLEKDYGSVVAKFADLNNSNPKVMPAKVAALVLADLYWEYKKYDLAVKILEKSSEPKPKDLVDYMITKKLSATYLSLGQFDSVIKKNQSIMAASKYPFMNSYFKLQMGLAYEGLKQWDLAEAQFKDVISKGDQTTDLMGEEAKMKNRFGADQSAAEQAQKYLLLLRLKKSESQAGV
jgi:predicted negative regulator of RcsB-dependent stress response